MLLAISETLEGEGGKREDMDGFLPINLITLVTNCRVGIREKKAASTGRSGWIRYGRYGKRCHQVGLMAQAIGRGMRGRILFGRRVVRKEKKKRKDKGAHCPPFIMTCRCGSRQWVDECNEMLFAHA